MRTPCSDRKVRARPSSPHSRESTLVVTMAIPMVGRDTLGEVVLDPLGVTGARTEVPGMTALVVLLLFAVVVQDPAWTSPPSPFPPSSSLLDKEG